MALPFTLADTLRACLDAQWEVGDPARPGEICLRAGQEVPFNFGTAQDECCTGLAWVRVASITPLTSFGAGSGKGPTTLDSPCHQADAQIVFEMGVARCSPFGDASAGPSCDQWTDLAFRIDDDAVRMRRALCCLDTAVKTDPAFVHVHQARLGLWEPLPINGMCAGGSMQVTIETSCTDC